MSKPREYYALKSELIDADNFDTFRPEDFTRVREVLPATECEAERAQEDLELLMRTASERDEAIALLAKVLAWCDAPCDGTALLDTGEIRALLAKAKGRAE